jgi:hypothetical protein
VRDNFTSATKEKLAKRAGYLCSNPYCRRLTIGAAQGHDGVLKVGVAAHITAASPGGPRYDPSLTREQRRDASNGIWMCQTHGDLVDGDDKHFTVKLLRGWKRDAELRSFEALLGLGEAFGARQVDAASALEGRLGVAADRDADGAMARVLEVSAADLAAFKRMPGWPGHPVALNLRMKEGASSPALHVAGLAAAVEAFNEFTIIAPPGTGKTTTLIQVGDAINAARRAAALFIPLSEWSWQGQGFLGSFLARPGFGSVSERDLAVLSEAGRLVLMLDGWNELDAEARRRATAALRMLQRAYPRLGIIITTRREALDLPIGGHAVEIDFLNDEQQLEIARAYRGEEGEALLDDARRAPGIRELVTIPLYLTALLASMPGNALPTTKEEVLRLFARQHEGPAEKAEALRASLFGFHPLMLQALAAEATHAANTAISDAQARAVVKGVEDKLVADGQIISARQPMQVLDVLVSQHALVRSGSGVLSFQHQQFQEWYASFTVEQAMREAASGDRAAVERLRVEFLDNRAWEEPILFACERLSREEGDGAHVVAQTGFSALSIDPLLTAEIIYRSSEEVWRLVGERVMAFVQRWHVPGKIDRAVRFTIASGRPEFAPTVWPFVESPDSQIYLSVMRAARRFRPSVLGPRAASRLAELPDATRGHVLAELAMRSGIEGMGLATAIAKTDPSADVQFEVVQALHFRRGDRHVRELLKSAPDAVWVHLSQRGYSGDITDPAAAERLRIEWEKLVVNAADPSVRIGMLLHGREVSPEDEAAIEDAVASGDFPVRDQHAGSTLYLAWERYPEVVGRGLLRRLADGLELPFGADEYLAKVSPVDDGPVAGLATDNNAPERPGITAARVAGPKVARALMDAVADAANRLAAAPHNEKRGPSDELRMWEDRLAVTPAASFFSALLSRDTNEAPHVIGAIASVIAQHGSHDQDKPLLELGGEAGRVIALVSAWARVLVADSESHRHQLSSLATAIGRLGRTELLDALKSLRDQDEQRRREAREQARAAGALASVELRSDAAMGYHLQYRDAFARIGEPAAPLMIGYLDNEDFGFDAACALKAIYDRKHGVEKQSLFKSWPYLPDAAARRAERARGTGGGDTSYSDAIFAAVERLIAPGSTDTQQALAIMIARMGLTMAYHGKEKTIARLLMLPQLVRTKRELIAALVLAGEGFSADLALNAVSAWIDDARQHTWRFRESLWEVIGWLELLPFSDRPGSVLDGLRMVLDALPVRERMERVVRAAAAAPEFSVEQLAEMLRRFPGLMSQHEWAQAFLSRGTVTVVVMLIGFVMEGQLGTGPGSVEMWWLAREIAALAKRHPELKADVLRLYETASPGPGQRLLEQTLQEAAGSDGVLALVRGYARSGKHFDGSMHRALQHTAMDERPVSESSNAYNLHPISIALLRRELLAMLDDGNARIEALAEECLANIDYLRDYYGPAELEPRHPDIASGRPWPRVAELGGEFTAAPQASTTNR